MESSMLDMCWILVAGAIVFIMQPGFMCLESGFTRSKNNISVAMKNLADFVVSVLTFWAVGYGIMFGLSASGVTGKTAFFFPLEDNGAAAAFFFFQAMFCGTATTILSGATAERMRFGAHLAASAIISVLVYPFFGHWAWNGLDTGTLSGWLGEWGFVDFAGSTVVHSVGGWVALAALLVVGPRKGRFNKNGSVNDINASNLPLAVLGTMLLWFGWFGFNGGSTLIMDGSVALVIARTTLAGAAAAMSCLVAGWVVNGVPKAAYLINGSLGGLVAITANCHCVDATGAFIIGVLAGPICLASEALLLRFRIDDAVGAVPVHLACGIWGTLAVAFFGNPEILGTGLSFGGQLLVQATGVLAAGLIAFFPPYLIFRAIHSRWSIRVSEEAEWIGLNVSEHGARTDTLDLYCTMESQAKSKNLSMRLPEEPFTEIGGIARQYNRVMDALEKAAVENCAIVSGAMEAIITFCPREQTVISANPSAGEMFGLPVEDMVGMNVNGLIHFNGTRLPDGALRQGRHPQLTGVRPDGGTFPIDATITNAVAGGKEFQVGIFRDISQRIRQEQCLKDSEERYRSFFENTGTASVILDNDGFIIAANSEFETMSGYTMDEIITKLKFTDFLAETDLSRVENYHRLRRKGDNLAPKAYEIQMKNRNGRIFTLYVNASLIPGTQRSIVSLLDLSKLKESQREIEKQRAYFHQLFEKTPQAIVMINLDGCIIEANAEYTNLFGYERHEILGRLNRKLIVPDERMAEAEAFNLAARSGQSVHKETVRRHKDGHTLPVDLISCPIKVDGSIEGLFYIYEDISERKSFEEQLRHQAFHDSTTGIPNRALFMERLERAIERSKRRPNYRFAVLLVDLDRFKSVNDTLGHQAGDTLLVNLAITYQSLVRSMDTVARLGGDEFAILVEEFNSPREVIGIARRIRNASRASQIIEDHEVRIGASIGIVLKTAQYTNAKDILRDADLAMYRAKEMGRGRFRVFNRKMYDHAMESLQLEGLLRGAIENGDLVLHYQPIMAANNCTLQGFEALVRWQHTEMGLIPPNKFIPLAEDTGLIIPLGRWVINEACRQMKEWLMEFPDQNLSVSVNISGRQFRQKDLAAFITQVLEKYELAPRHLKVEITETTVMESPESAVEQLNRLRTLGVEVLIDDFGTGYCSLAYLQQFPISCLKIDRSFVNGLGVIDEKLEIVKTIIALARNLGISVVAEGVEDNVQIDQLKRLSCDSLQGFYFSRPVESSEATGWIRRHARPASAHAPDSSDLLSVVPSGSTEGVMLGA